ncbi:MAG: hypothetical protein U5K69_05260 [Balneolaceae bacterium]|nr:hypothetical protein [Balneolaceae bacterium]
MSKYTSASSELVYMNAGRVERTLKRMAYQVAESNRRNQKVVLFGIEDRGYWVARQLNEFLEDIYGSRFPLLRLGMKLICPNIRISPAQSFAMPTCLLLMT